MSEEVLQSATRKHLHKVPAFLGASKMPAIDGLFDSLRLNDDGTVTKTSIGRCFERICGLQPVVLPAYELSLIHI